MMLKCKILDYEFDAVQVLVAHRPSESCTMTIYLSTENKDRVADIYKACEQFTPQDSITVIESDGEYVYKKFKIHRLSFDSFVFSNVDAGTAETSTAFCSIFLKEYKGEE